MIGQPRQALPPVPTATRLPCTCGPEIGRCTACQAWEAWEKQQGTAQHPACHTSGEGVGHTDGEVTTQNLVDTVQAAPRGGAFPPPSLPMSPFEVAAWDELERLSAQKDAIHCHIDALVETLAVLEKQATALQAYLVTVGAVFDRPPLPSRRSPSTKIGRPISLHSDVVHIENVLQRSGVPLHYKEILTRLAAEEQVVIKGRSPGANIRARLHAYPQFQNSGKGYYCLAGLAEPANPPGPLGEAETAD